MPRNPTPNIKPHTIRFPKDIHEQLQLYSQINEVPLNTLVIEAVKAYLAGE